MTLTSSFTTPLKTREEPRRYNTVAALIFSPSKPKGASMRPGTQWLRILSPGNHKANLEPFLSSLVTATSSLSSAKRELSWMLKHVQDTRPNAAVGAQNDHLSSLVAKRARGVPMQYLLRSEYFGDLKLKCKKRVLIPRYARSIIILNVSEAIEYATLTDASVSWR